MSNLASSSRLNLGALEEVSGCASSVAAEAAASSTGFGRLGRASGTVVCEAWSTASSTLLAVYVSAGAGGDEVVSTDTVTGTSVVSLARRASGYASWVS